MARRPIEPDESIEPGVDGLEEIRLLEARPAWASVEAGSSEVLDCAVEPEVAEEIISEPELLVFGQGVDVAALLALARSCGFKIQLATLSGEGMENFQVDKRTELGDFGSVVADCDIGRDTFVSIFLDDEADCELILSQCLASDARYIGVSGNSDKLAEIFSALKADGAPDAELAAIAAPMGLNVGAATPEQRAVAIMAEMLAAKAGKLKKLRYGRGKGWRGSH